MRNAFQENSKNKEINHEKVTLSFISIVYVNLSSYCITHL